MILKRGTTTIARFVAVAGLGAAAITVGVSSATAASYGPTTNGCYGIYWNTDWNQECGSSGASAAGYYKSTADCTAPQVTDSSLEKYRVSGSKTSYDGSDCNYGIHNVLTWYRTA